MPPRTERSHKAILDATMSLLDGDDHSPMTVQELTVERVAREARVSKTTIYRWWPNKTALVIDAFLTHKVWRLPVRVDLPAIDALREHVVTLTTMYSGKQGELVSQLIAECQYEPNALEELKTRFWNERSSAVIGLIERAIAEGDLRSDLDPETFADLLYGPVYFRLLLRSGPLDAAFAARILDTALQGALA